MKHIKSIVAGAAIAAAALAITENSGACTRVVYHARLENTYPHQSLCLSRRYGKGGFRCPGGSVMDL